MQNGFREGWRIFRDAVDARNRRLVQDLTAVWHDLQGLEKLAAEAFGPANQWTWAPHDFSSLERLFNGDGQLLVIRLADRYSQQRPLYRMLSALDDWRLSMADLPQSLPPSIEISGQELMEALGREAHGEFWTRLAKWRKGTQTARPRAWTRAVVRRETARATGDFGRVMLNAKTLSLALFQPWLEVRGKALIELLGQESDAADFNRARSRWLAENQRREAVQEAALASLSQRLQDIAPAIAEGLLSGLYRDPPRASASEQRVRNAAAFWNQASRAVEAMVELSASEVRVGADAVAEIGSSIESIHSENAALLKELVGCMESLEQAGASCTLPASGARVLPARERSEYFLRSLRRSAAVKLPEQQEVLDPRHATPPFYSPWKRIRPRRLFERAVDIQAPISVEPAFAEAAASNQAIVRDIERAREVVEFAYAEAERAGADGAQLVAEGRENALTLLKDRLGSSASKGVSLSSGMLQAVCHTFAQYWAGIERGQFGPLSVRARRAAYYFAGSSFRTGKEMARDLSLATWRHLRQGYHWSLVGIGWELPPGYEEARVARAGFVSSTLHINFQAKQLPMIYRRLFRLAPVEDPRFLVGREAEMQALAEARDLWLEQHAVAVLLVGVRGSGKTSLLNCSRLQVFPESAFARFTLTHRIPTSEALQQHLKDLFGIPEEQDLREFLREERRVVVLEEIERAYLRSIGGMGAIRELLSLIADTSKTTLWILAINREAHRLLRAAVGMDNYFSHRLEATAVSPEAVREAILQRHNLSGLRLSFTSGATRRPWVDHVRRVIGMDEDPETVFFRKLYAQSGGIYRSSFELWQRYIDRAEAGTLYLGKPEAPDYELLLSGLSREDLFSLQAVLQHGYLTVAEHAVIFSLPEGASRTRVERLINREILEPEPYGEGWRVRPEAAYLVRRALAAENLV